MITARQEVNLTSKDLKHQTVVCFYSLSFFTRDAEVGELRTETGDVAYLAAFTLKP